MIPEEKIEQAAKLVNVYKHFEEYEAFKDGFYKGSRFAEAEIQTFEIDFCGHVKAKLKVEDGKLSIIAAMNGYGDALDPDQIIITQLEQ